MKYRIALIIASLLVSICNSFSQSSIHSMSDGERRIYYSTIEEAETKLIEYAHELYTNEGYSTGGWANNGWLFPIKMFSDLIIQDERTFDYDFERLVKDCKNNSVNISISYYDSEAIKLYSVDISGGRMTDFAGITSIKVDNRVFSYNYTDKENHIINIAPGGVIAKRQKNDQNEEIYFITDYLRVVGREYYATITAYKRSGYKFLEYKAFVDADGSVSSEKTIRYDPFTYPSYKDDPPYFDVIGFSGDNIYMSETRKNEFNLNGDIFTGRKLNYFWNGNQYVFKMYSYESDLHPSLQNYSSNVFLLKLQNRFIVRIDKMPNGSYRYSSWDVKNSGLDMSLKPSLVLKNGYEEVSVVDRGAWDGKNARYKYVFQNNEYSYVLTWLYDYSVKEAKLEVKRNNTLIMTLKQN